MKINLKTLRGEIFATCYLYLPPVNPVGFIFSYNGETYKVIDACYNAYEKEVTFNETNATFIVTPVQHI